MILLIAILIVLISCSALFSASETALFSLSSMKVKAFKQSGDKRSQLIASLLARPRDLLVTLIMSNVMVNILVQNVVSSIFQESNAWLLNVAVPLCLTLVFGEAIPKSLSLANNARISYAIAPLMDRLQRFLLPFRRLLIAATSALSRLLFFFFRSEEEISIDELQHALKTSRQYGLLAEDEAELVRGYLKLQESTVKEHMRPREDVLFFNLDEPLSRLIHLFVDQECTRIPVCQDGLDQTVGIMTSRLFFLHRPNLKSNDDLLPILKKPYFVPETTSSQKVLRQMYDSHESIAMVIDEYGSISGLVSLEDLVEAVVGEIADRRDQKVRYTRSGEDTVIASGKLELAEFEKIFGIPLHSKNNMVTIGGWLTEEVGDIPKTGAKIIKGDFLFHVLSADSKRIRRVYIRKLRVAPPKKKRVT